MATLHFNSSRWKKPDLRIHFPKELKNNDLRTAIDQSRDQSSLATSSRSQSSSRMQSYRHKSPMKSKSRPHMRKFKKGKRYSNSKANSVETENASAPGASDSDESEEEYNSNFVTDLAVEYGQIEIKSEEADSSDLSND